jgi:aminopeptidase N
MRLLVTLIFLTIASISAPAQRQEKEPPLTSGRPAPPEQTCYDVLHYDLSVEVKPEEQSISGNVEIRAKLLEKTGALVLDLHEALEVTAVNLISVDQDEARLEHVLPFEHEDGEIRISVKKAFKAIELSPGGEFLLQVKWSGQPRVAPNPPWDGGFQWSKTPSGAHWIATSNQMQGPDLWWPCKDQPDDEADSARIQVTVPQGLVCASNGQLEDVSNAEGKNTYVWRVTTPINTYGIALNIAPYETISQEYTSVAGDTFAITYWVLPENVEQGRVLFQDILKQMAWFESVYGPYPFRGDKYGVVETPHLGMEHQSIIAYGNGYRGNPWGADQGFDFLHHHEFAHEWWANLVTCRNWNDFWIHEGFGTYAQSLYTEHLHGPEGYRKRMAEIRRGIRNRAPVAPREPMSTADVYFGDTGGDIYNKGAWVLHSLRWLVGDEDFFVALRRMAYPDPELENKTDGSACRFSDTDEILSIAEEHTGRDLDWFFELYLRQPTLPELEEKRSGGTLTLEWKTPDGMPFPMPVEISVDGELQRIEMKKGKAKVKVGKSQELIVDPNTWLLKKEERALRRKPRRE